jgi:hypothetical protein
MSFFDRLVRALNVGSQGLEHPTPLPAEPKPKPKTPRRSKQTLSAKELATQQGEPYVTIVSFSLDPDDLRSGAFELDWNDKFIANLVRAGYQRQANEPESDIVDRWFQEICRSVVLEYYEQEQADPDVRRLNRKNLGDGRTEIS